MSSAGKEVTSLRLDRQFKAWRIRRRVESIIKRYGIPTGLELGILVGVSNRYYVTKSVSREGDDFHLLFTSKKLHLFWPRSTVRSVKDINNGTTSKDGKTFLEKRKLPKRRNR